MRPAVWVPLLVGALSMGVLARAFLTPEFQFSGAPSLPAQALLALLGLIGALALLLSGQRRLAQGLAQQVHFATELQGWGEALRAADDPLDQGPALCRLLQQGDGEPSLMMLTRALPQRNDPSALRWAGAEPDADTLAGLWLCLRHSSAMGPGSGRHEEQKAFRAFVTPTHFVVRKLVYKWLCWAPVKMDEVIPLRRVQAVDVDWCCYKTLRVYTGDRDADNQPAVTIVCL